jgi:hypothetical protein
LEAVPAIAFFVSPFILTAPPLPAGLSILSRVALNALLHDKRTAPGDAGA